MASSSSSSSVEQAVRGYASKWRQRQELIEGCAERSTAATSVQSSSSSSSSGLARGQDPTSGIGSLFVAVDSVVLKQNCPTVLQELNRYIADFVVKCANAAATLSSSDGDDVLPAEHKKAFKEYSLRMWHTLCKTDTTNHVMLQLFVAGLGEHIKTLHTAAESFDECRQLWLDVSAGSEFFRRMYIAQWMPHLSLEMRKKVCIRFQQLGYVCKTMLVLPTTFTKQIEKGLVKAMRSENVQANKAKFIESLCNMATNLQKRIVDGEIAAPEDDQPLTFSSMLGFLREMGDTNVMGDWTSKITSVLTEDLIQKLDSKVEDMKTRYLPEIMAKYRKDHVKHLLRKVLREILLMDEFQQMITQNKWNGLVDELFAKLDSDKTVAEVLSEVISNTTATFTATSDTGELTEKEMEDRETMRDSFSLMLEYVVNMLEDKIESSL